MYGELERRGIHFRPHMWLSEEWFSPDGIPGIAVPFYLAHPRLMRLERRMMRQVEGGNANWMMRILRHEVGHAIDTAYRLAASRAMARDIRSRLAALSGNLPAPGRAAGVSCSIWATGTHRAIPPRTLPKPSQCG